MLCLFVKVACKQLVSQERIFKMYSALGIIALSALFALMVVGQVLIVYGIIDLIQYPV
jgi:hypothetical protein